MTFAEALTEAMTAKGVRVNALANHLGTSHSLVSRWLNGEAVPSLAMGDALSEHLCAPNVLLATLAERKRRCRRCNARFLAVNRNQIYCTRSCKHAVDQARANKRDVSARKLRTARLERAVAAYCRACEPDGLCRMSQCELRAVSPLPLLRRRAA